MRQRQNFWMLSFCCHREQNSATITQRDGMKRVKKRRKHNIFIYQVCLKTTKNIEYVQLHEYYTMCRWHGQIGEDACIRSHVDNVLAGDSSSRVLKISSRPTSCLRCRCWSKRGCCSTLYSIQRRSETRDDGEWERIHTGHKLECGACTNEYVDKSPKVYTQLAREGVVLTQDSDNI